MTKNFKRFTAMAMATVMVIGSAMTVVASEGGQTTPAPKTEDSSEGTGTPEGHVVKKKTQVTLPTVAAGTFSYTMDPEGLIQATAKKKYGSNVTFPGADVDTGVYFQTASTQATKSYTKKAEKPDGADADEWTAAADTLDKDAYDALAADIQAFYDEADVAATATYANDSNAVTVTNESSHKIKLTVKAEVISESTDIPLVVKDAIKGNQNADPKVEKADKASLYLDLKVDNGAAEAILKGSVVTKEVELDGKEGYFTVDYDEDDKEYIYRVMSVAEVNANKETGAADITELAWATSSFHLEGAVTSGLDIDDTTTAPKVKVTWKYEDPSAVPAVALSGSYSRANTANKFTLSNIGNLTIARVNAYMDDGSRADDPKSGSWSVNTEKTELTINGSTFTFGAGAVGKTRGIGIVLSDGTEIKTTFTVNQ